MKIYVDAGRCEGVKNGIEVESLDEATFRRVAQEHWSELTYSKVATQVLIWNDWRELPQRLLAVYTPANDELTVFSAQFTENFPKS